MSLQRQTGALLVVDWDFFFPTTGERTHPGLWDWGHREAPFFIDGIWTIRASGFLYRGLPLPGLSGEQDGFWERFKFASKTTLYFAESNSAAADRRVLSRPWREVWLFDAHHDCGYGSDLADIIAKGGVDCGEWGLLYLAGGAQFHVRYPRWKTWAFEAEPEDRLSPFAKGLVDRRFDDPAEAMPVFDKVFVCRSGAWVPSWLDEHYEAFLALAPPRRKVDLGSQERVWDERDAIAHVEAARVLEEKLGRLGQRGIQLQRGTSMKRST